MKKIPLTNSNKPAIVDDGDFRKASRRRWCFTEGYVLSIDRPHTYLHHLVNGRPPLGLQTDHRNGNGLDNRKQNLRFATKSQNGANAGKYSNNLSGFKGVSRCSDREKWRAQITSNGRVFNLGHFDSPIEAAKVYDKAAKKFHGEFAKLNFPMRFSR